MNEVPCRRGFVLAGSEQPDLVPDRTVAELRDTKPRIDHAGKRQRAMEATTRLHDEADGRPFADIEPSLAHEVLVDYRVEVGIVDDVIHVAVDDVVHPARRDGEKAAEIGASQRCLHVDQRAAERRRPSNTSIQCRTGRRAPLARCVRHPILAVMMTPGLAASSAASLFAFNWRESSGWRIE